MKPNQRVIVDAGTGSRFLYRKVRTADGLGWTREEAGVEEFSYEVLFDEGEASALAAKAAGNKSGRSRDGALEVVILSRQRGVR